jgi:high-affinity nickel-transport protein
MVGVVKAWKQAKSGKYSHEHLEQLLNDRSIMRRIFKGKFKKGFDHSYQLYPIGVLFGLGFDTATEVGLLALSATAAAGTVGGVLPPLAIIALPIIFAAGMSMMDALDGIFMTKAYSWAFTSPLRKIYYNLTTTGLSVFVALGIGTLQWISVASDNFGLAETEPFKTITSVDLSSIGYFIVLSFVLAFAVSILIWKIGKYEERFGSKIKESSHTHSGLHIG